MSRTQSILLQVAYKGVVQYGFQEAADFKSAILRDYNVLVDLHKELGLSLEDAPKKSWGGDTAPAKKVVDAPVTTFGGVDYYDYRGQKELGLIENPKHPDFKPVDTSKKSEWILKSDGEKTKFAEANDL